VSNGGTRHDARVYTAARFAHGLHIKIGYGRALEEKDEKINDCQDPDNADDGIDDLAMESDGGNTEEKNGDRGPHQR